VNTFELGNLVKNTLIEPETKAFQRSIEILINKNKGENEASHYMFMFAGSVYKIKTQVLTNHSAPSLDISLVGEMQENLKMLKDSKREVQNVWQALLPIVELTGVENGLPDSLKTILPTKFGLRIIPFEAALGQCPDIVCKNWEKSEKFLHYFISLRLAL
jgi:hypothetical protein